MPDGKDVFLFFSTCSFILFFITTIMYVCFVFECTKIVTVRIDSKSIRIDTWFGFAHWNQQLLLTNKIQVFLQYDTRADIRRNMIIIKDDRENIKWNIPQIDEANWIISEIQKFLVNNTYSCSMVVPVRENEE
jgi:hypothetical protein